MAAASSAVSPTSLTRIFRTRPGGIVWLSFSEGATNTTRETFDAFFAKACS